MGGRFYVRMNWWPWGRSCDGGRERERWNVGGDIFGRDFLAISTNVVVVFVLDLSAEAVAFEVDFVRRRGGISVSVRSSTEA